MLNNPGLVHNNLLVTQMIIRDNLNIDVEMIRILVAEFDSMRSVIKYPPRQICMAVFGLATIVNIGRYCGLFHYTGATKRTIWKDFGSPPWTANHR